MWRRGIATCASAHVVSAYPFVARADVRRPCTRRVSRRAANGLAISRSGHPASFRVRTVLHPRRAVAHTHIHRAMYLWLWLVVHRSRYPYIEAEVRYAAREYACTAADVLARRTRLAFLNRFATPDAPTCGCMNPPHLFVALWFTARRRGMLCHAWWTSWQRSSAGMRSTKLRSASGA